ncbi:MAG: hypothetical protein Kow009_14350 [Spirochaetales bacterium]
MDPEILIRIESCLTNQPFTAQKEHLQSLRYFGGIVGGEQPSRYSQSPLLWNRLFRRLEIPALFVPFDLPSSRDLVPFLETVLQTPYCLDLTVTNPYKQAAYQALEELKVRCTVTDRVRHLGSLNHIIRQPDGWFVDSTDGEGMVRAIRKRISLEGRRVLLVGAGGAAASIGYELVQEGVDLRIVNIIEQDAHILKERLSRIPGSSREVSSFPAASQTPATEDTGANDTGPFSGPPSGWHYIQAGVPSGRPFHSRVQAGGWDRIEEWAAESEVIISAITESSPLDREELERLAPSVLLVDTRYGEQAVFARLGRSLGRTVIDGKEMLFGQFHVAVVRLAYILGIPLSVLREELEAIEEEYLSS